MLEREDPNRTFNTVKAMKTRINWKLWLLMLGIGVGLASCESKDIDSDAGLEGTFWGYSHNDTADPDGLMGYVLLSFHKDKANYFGVAKVEDSAVTISFDLPYEYSGSSREVKLHVAELSKYKMDPVVSEALLPIYIWRKNYGTLSGRVNWDKDEMRLFNSQGKLVTTLERMKVDSGSEN